MAAIVTMVLGACVAPTAQPGAASGELVSEIPAAGAVTSERCGDPSRLSSTVSFYNWANYIDESILSMFEAECGVRVIYDTYASNEDLLAKLQAGATGYDLIVPSDYMVSIMLELEMLRPLDHGNLPNLVNISDRFADAPYDPGFVYSVPYQWGTTGITVDLDVIDDAPDGWAALFDPDIVSQYNGRVSLLNDARETLGAALKYLGYSVNSTNPDELEEAKQVLLAIKPYVATFENDAYRDLLVSGEVNISHSWSGDAFQVIYANEERSFDYIIPAEGGVIWVDNMVIPATAPNPYTAEILINYLLEPEIGAMITNYNYYASPNDASFEFLEVEVREDPGIYPPDEVLDRMEFIRNVGEATLLWERIWTEVRAGQ
jgi:spermidine/putrescine transport system substrate-binding protein